MSHVVDDQWLVAERKYGVCCRLLQAQAPKDARIESEPASKLLGFVKGADRNQADKHGCWPCIIRDAPQKVGTGTIN